MVKEYNIVTTSSDIVRTMIRPVMMWGGFYFSSLHSLIMGCDVSTTHYDEFVLLLTTVRTISNVLHHIVGRERSEWGHIKDMTFPTRSVELGAALGLFDMF